MEHATSREIFTVSVVITDYLRAIYGENSLIDEEKEKSEGSGEDKGGKEGGIVVGEDE